MASREPLEAKAVWQTSAARLTAVAVSVREGHSIAFLGDSKGTLHKVSYSCEHVFMSVGFSLSPVSLHEHAAVKTGRRPSHLCIREITQIT